MALLLNNSNLQNILSSIEADFGTYLAMYDETKYSPAVLESCRTNFSRPSQVTAADITTALRWKYGNLGKARMSSKWQPLIGSIYDLWSTYLDEGEPVGEDGFMWWRDHLPTYPYITIVFLMHLRTPDDVPIIDQHNFRAIQHLLQGAGVKLQSRKKPSTWDHVCLIRDFCSHVLASWPADKAEAKPSASDLDRYLMMRGKALKQRRPRTRPIAIGTIRRIAANT